MTLSASGRTVRQSLWKIYRGAASRGKSVPYSIDVFPCGLKETEYAEYDAKNRDIICDNGIHIVVFRLKPVMAVFFVKSLYGGGIVYEGDYHIAIGGGGLLAD